MVVFRARSEKSGFLGDSLTFWQKSGPSGEKKIEILIFEVFSALHFIIRTSSNRWFVSQDSDMLPILLTILKGNVSFIEEFWWKPSHNSDFTDSIDLVKRNASKMEGKPISFCFYLPWSFYNILDGAYRPETTDFHWSAEQATKSWPRTNPDILTENYFTIDRTHTMSCNLKKYIFAYNLITLLPV